MSKSYFSGCMCPERIKNKQGDWQLVRCGKCPDCIQHRRFEWCIRLQREIRYATAPAWFVTLTYDNENLVYGEKAPTLVKRDFVLFMKRFRKVVFKNHGYKLRFLGVGEYGGQFGRPHYHIVLIGPPLSQYSLTRYLLNSWGKCEIICVEPCLPSVTAYVLKDFLAVSSAPEGSAPGFMLMSRNPGIGSFCAEMLRRDTLSADDPRRLQMMLPGGSTVAMPRYLQQKAYSPVEREFISAGRKMAEQLKPMRDYHHEVDDATFIQIYERKKQHIKHKFDNGKTSKV